MYDIIVICLNTFIDYFDVAMALDFISDKYNKSSSSEHFLDIFTSLFHFVVPLSGYFQQGNFSFANAQNKKVNA